MGPSKENEWLSLLVSQTQGEITKIAGCGTARKVSPLTAHIAPAVLVNVWMNVCVFLLVIRIDDPFKAAPGNKHNLPKRPHRCRHMALNDCFVWNNTGPLRLQPRINLENEARISALQDVRRRQYQRASVWRAVFGETLPWAWEPAFISHSTPALCDCVGSVNKAVFPFLLSFQLFTAFTSRRVSE